MAPSLTPSVSEQDVAPLLNRGEDPNARPLLPLDKEVIFQLNDCNIDLRN